MSAQEQEAANKKLLETPDDQLTDKERAKKEKLLQKQAEKNAKAEKLRLKLEKQAQTKPKEKDPNSNSADANDEKKKKGKKEQPKEEPFVNTTPPGEKKDTSTPMRASYEPFAVESAWYDWWCKKGFFHADNQSKAEKFVMVIPPPNVTGSLHLGHALTNSIQDSIVRWHRMQGRAALWVPGTDHAGIATQTVVEKRLAKTKGLSRHDLGREKFVSEVWKWKDEYGGKIINQLKRLGSSLDWDREVFTMDAKLSRAVTEAFCRLFEQGLIFRDTRLVNWCPKLNSAISDIEVDHLELKGKTKMKVPGHDGEYEFGVLHDFAYRVDGSDEEIIISTTRPETMLADTAVAVHPKDDRYKHLHGKSLVHPFIQRKIPIVTDDILVDMSFGTGAVKVTPAHDPNDFACGKRKNLEFINFLNDDGTLNENAGQFKGMKRFDARDAVVAALKEKNLYRGIRENPMTIGVCSRTKDVIEPMLKPQWWVNCKGMADRAVKAVKEGELEILPAEHRQTWFRWLENIHDWCISRQLWWGHRCPAYLVRVEGQDAPDPALNTNWVVGRNFEDAVKHATAKYPNVDPAKIKLEQDPDVLDTWFSSGLFPFSVFGWPEQTQDLQAFYPTSLLETGLDILFFWVARMVMLGLQLTDKLPFKQVFLHAMVRDAHGRKMSKSLGNVIDPIDMIQGISLEGLHEKLLDGNLDSREVEKAKQGQLEDFPKGIPECGTDAMRFALCAYTSQGRDINLDVLRVAGYRNFCNKLWNATKLTLMNLGPNFVPAAQPPKQGLGVWERWILSRLNFAIGQVNEGFKNYDFAQATTAIHSFFLYDLCDVYLEAMKPTMNANPSSGSDSLHQRQASMRETLYTCMDNGLRLLSPFMPFLTEELWQRLGRRSSPDQQWESICIAEYPKQVSAWSDEQIERDVKLAQDIIRAVRKMRNSFGLTKEKPQIFINFTNEDFIKVISPFTQEITFLSSSSQAELLFNRPTPEGCAVEVVNETCQVYLLIKGLINIEDEIKKLETKKAQSLSALDKIVKLTQGPNYHKVPEKTKVDNETKMQTLKQEINVIDDTINNYKKFL